MKRFLKINTNHKRINDTLIWEELLATLLPNDLRSQVSIQCRLEDCDPKISRAFELFDRAREKKLSKELNTKSRLHQSDPFEETHWVRYQYEYEEVDLVDANYFRVNPYEYVQAKRLSNDRWGVDVQVNSDAEDTTGSDLAWTTEGWGLLASPRFREAAEELGLVGLEFRETVPCRNVKTAKEADTSALSWGEVPHDPWLSLDSPIDLPSLHPDVKLRDWRTGAPAERGSTDRTLLIEEDRYPNVELHYLRDEIAKVEPFDLARTREPLVNVHEIKDRAGYPVVSRRFYDLCQDLDIKVTQWLPVYVDDE